MDRTTRPMACAERGLVALALPILLALAAPAFAQDAAPAAAGAAAIDAGAPPEQAPTGIVERFHATLIANMKHADERGYQGRFDELAPVITATFDLDFMAQKSVGRHWRKLDADSQARWRDSFVRNTTANYAGRFDAWDGEQFETLGEESAAHETMVVRTKLVLPDEEDVQLNYRLRETDGGWRVVDVYLNGTVSELALRRSEYSSVLKRSGFDTLIANVDQKSENLASGTVQ